MSDVVFFDAPGQFRAWLAVHHRDEPEIWLGFYRAGTGRTGITFADAADEALAFRWAEAERTLVDADSYAVRFAPAAAGDAAPAAGRRGGTTARARGRIEPAPRAAFAGTTGRGDEDDPARREMPVLDAEYEAALRADAAAWSFFNAQAPAYRRAAIWWVTSGKQEETRRRRLSALVEGSARGEKLPQLTRNL